MAVSRLLLALSLLVFCPTHRVTADAASEPPLSDSSSGPAKILSLTNDSSAMTDLGSDQVTCYDTPKYYPPVKLRDCIDAVYSTGRAQAQDFILPRYWKTREEEGSGVNVPISWHSGRCYMVIGSPLRKAREGFSLVQAAYYASLVVQECVLIQKTPLGGRFALPDNKFFVEITGNMGDSSLASANITAK